MRQVILFALLIAVFSMATFLTYAADIEDGLWMYLPMNEGAGDAGRFDYGPHGFDTELSKPAPKWVDAKHDYLKEAMEFDGESTFVKIDMAGQKNDSIDSHFQ